MATETGSVHIGALHAQNWAGLVLCPAAGEGFAFRFAVQLADGSRADGMDLFWLVHDVGAHAPDGSYARVAFDLDLPFALERETPLVRKAERKPGLVLEWSKEGDVGVLGRVTTGYQGALEVVPFFPWDWAGEWSLSPGHGSGPWELAGPREFSGAREVSGTGGLSGARGLSGAIDGTPPSSFLNGSPPSSVLKGVTDSGRWHCSILTTMTMAAAEGPFRLRLPVEGRTTLEFAAAIAAEEGEATERARGLLSNDVGSRLARAREEYENHRVQVQGSWQGLAASITNNLHWMVLLQPETGRLYVPAGRRWIFPAPDGTPDHWTVFGWDSYFNALELAVESQELAMAAVRAGLETQYPSGCIPNWRGRFGGTPDRSQPPVGSLAMAKILARFQNQEDAHEVLPALEGWAEFWRTEKDGHPRRDGDADGLFEWGSDAADISSTPPPWEVDASGWQRAAWESGQDDLPNWEEALWVDQAETFDLACVDLNSYLALDLECLAWLNQAVGRTDQSQRFENAYHRLRDRMNERLWNEERGLYLDRKWSGEWSPRVAASNFLPLVAGIPDEDQASRMMEILMDPEWFWGDYVVPTISRNDPAFQEQQYWRGTIWPPMNYLVYQGVKRYGFDALAGELAQRSVALFLRSWRDYRLCRENYDSRTGEGGGQRYQSWGPLFALIGLEEFFDVTPWGGTTIGSLAPPGEASVRRIHALGRRWDVAMGPSGLRLDLDGRTVLTSTAPVVLRHLEVDPVTLSCETHAVQELEVRVGHPATEFTVRMDGTPWPAQDRVLRVPEGKHNVHVQTVQVGRG